MKVIDLDIIRKRAKANIDSYFVLKSNAYGLGLKTILDTLLEVGCYRFAVTNFDDSLYIRSVSEKAYILHMGPIVISRINEYKEKRIIPSVCHYHDVNYLDNMDIEIKVNTGRNRFGVDIKDINNMLPLIKKRHLTIKGVYTHVASRKSYQKQRNLLASLTYLDTLTHINSSRFIDDKVCRLGFSLYKDALSIYAKVIEVRNVKKGEYVGYDKKIKKDSIIAILDIGYNEGLQKNNIGRLVFCDNQFFEIFNICMNHTMIIVNHNVLDCIVEIMGKNITIEYLSSKLKMSPYEILTIYRNMETKYLSK